MGRDKQQFCFQTELSPFSTHIYNSFIHAMIRLVDAELTFAQAAPPSLPPRANAGMAPSTTRQSKITRQPRQICTHTTVRRLPELQPWHFLKCSLTVYVRSTVCVALYARCATEFLIMDGCISVDKTTHRVRTTLCPTSTACQLYPTKATTLTPSLELQSISR